MGTELVGMRGHSRKAVRMVCAQGWGSRGRPRNCNSPSSWSSVGDQGGGRLGCGLGGARVKSSCPRALSFHLEFSARCLGHLRSQQSLPRETSSTTQLPSASHSAQFSSAFLMGSVCCLPHHQQASSIFVSMSQYPST